MAVGVLIADYRVAGIGNPAPFRRIGEALARLMRVAHIRIKGDVMLAGFRISL